MNNFITPRGDSGLSQAWLMATVGTKPAQRRALKRDLQGVSIPRICDEVSSLADETSNLRLTSNLLYGLSLMYKQKVTFMATDLALVYERISTPLFTKGVAQRQTLKRTRGSTEVNVGSLLTDNPQFNVDLDFVDDFLDDYFVEEHESHEQALAIREQDRGVGGTIVSKLPAYLTADAQEKSFLDYLNRTNTTREISLEECLTVDFEFDEDGNIIDHGPRGVDDHEDFLQDLNIDEEIVAVSGSIEELSKSLTHIANQQDPGSLRQAEANAVDVNDATNAIKRRKYRPIADRQLNISNNRQTTQRDLAVLGNQQTVSDIFYKMSLTQPPFLNMCYRMIFGASDAFRVNVDKLPSTSRHANTSKLDSFLKDMEDEIERGRNISSRRPSSSLVDEVPLPILTPTTETSLVDVDFDIEPLSPMLQELDEEETTNEIQQMQKLKEFEQYLQDRVLEISESNPWRSENGYSLESLIPSRSTPDDNPIERRLAANAVSCLLSLANRGSIGFRTTDEEMTRPLQPDEIYINFF